MGDFEDAITRFDALRVRLAARASDGLAGALDHQTLLAPTFTPGEGVRDAVTGQAGTVVSAGLINVVLPPA